MVLVFSLVAMIMLPAISNRQQVVPTVLAHTRDAPTISPAIFNRPQDAMMAVVPSPAAPRLSPVTMLLMLAAKMGAAIT